MNMLSAKKVRLHGMKSSRWTTRDKLTQYKGLINLFARDRKILSLDAAVARKKQIKELKQLRKEIKLNRSDLENAVQGDRQQLRNALSDHRDLQLAFQNSSAIKIIDYLHQGNFNKRKLLDRMDYRMKQKTQTLINLKLELAVYQDRLQDDGHGQIPIECDAQVVTGKVQDATLKKEAALSVRHTYRKILNILKKDSLYFDAVLETLKLDGFSQGKCMVRTTELGQLATEYLDDRKQEFKELERAVKRDMKARELTLKIVRQEVVDVTNNLSLLIRRDSDINVGRVIIPLLGADSTLQRDIESIEYIFRALQETVFVSTFENVFPCLTEQQRQGERLRDLCEQCIADRDNLLNKKQHGETMHATLKYTMNETTFGYISEKTRLSAEIEKERLRTTDTRDVDITQSQLLVKVRSALHQLSQKCTIITLEEKKDKPAIKVALKATIEHGAKKAGSDLEIIKPPPEFEEDGLKIISQLEPKLYVLISNAPPPLDTDKTDQAYRLFQQLVSEICTTIHYDVLEVDDSLISDMAIEDAQVPTYNEIKKLSKELVEISTVDEDLVPLFTPKKKKLKLK